MPKKALRAPADKMNHVEMTLEQWQSAVYSVRNSLVKSSNIKIQS
jgi:hypothetical protein